MPSEDSAQIDHAIADLRPQGPRRPLRAVCTLDDRMRELCLRLALALPSSRTSSRLGQGVRSPKDRRKRGGSAGYTIPNGFDQ